ncbi:M48 family metallopeptidase [Lentibacter sp.]|uniref:M48 family metallopeptidase n=1 Tax=Lentibacter sp. TaxID=2024994 RepID=UPI003F6CC4C0
MSFIKKGFLGLALLALAACDVPVETSAPLPEASSGQASQSQLSARAAARQFVDVVETVEPVAERECRARAPGMNCDFRIVIDDRPGQPVNAYQTLDKTGQPILAFTIAMIADVRNADELAFVMGHEAAHHIEGHIARQQRNAQTGALVFAGLAALTGADAQVLQNVGEIGAQVGARTYSKDYELEADILGTVITKKAGYNPVRGAAFFSRIPDPGDRFLGTHPPNAQRIEVVRQTASQL